MADGGGGAAIVTVVAEQAVCFACAVELDGLLAVDTFLLPGEARQRGDDLEAQARRADELAFHQLEDVDPLAGGNEGVDLLDAGDTGEAGELLGGGAQPVVFAAGGVAEGGEGGGGGAHVHEVGPEVGKIFGLGIAAEVAPGGEGAVGVLVIGAPEVDAEIEVGFHVHVDHDVEKRGGGGHLP